MSCSPSTNFVRTEEEVNLDTKSDNSTERRDPKSDDKLPPYVIDGNFFNGTKRVTGVP